MLKSMVCRYEHFLSDWYGKWAQRLPLGLYVSDASPRPTRPHRKAWEWCAIAQALDERSMLQPGRTACGFAVGTEPLPAAFAARGVIVLATDQGQGDNADVWGSTSQHAASLEAIYRPELIDRHTFDSLVSFQPVDMRNLLSLEGQAFDFVWSSCSFEHLGGLEPGIQFVTEVMKLVKPGGMAVHTTEFNVASNDATIDAGWSVIYRQRDIEEMGNRLRRIGCGLAACDFYAGDHEFDLAFDVPPFGGPDRQHIKLLLDGHLTTSMMLVIRKGI